MVLVGRQRAALLLGALAVLLTACSSPQRPEPPVGEVTDSADCLASNLRYLAGAPLLPTVGAHAPAPLPGTLPEGFRPARVTLCHFEDGDGGAAVVEELRAGDIPAVVAAFAMPSSRPEGSCSQEFEAVPELFLVDADGRAVRMAWPLDGCGTTRAEARTAIASLAVLADRRTPLLRLPPTSGGGPVGVG